MTLRAVLLAAVGAFLLVAQGSNTQITKTAGIVAMTPGEAADLAAAEAALVDAQKSVQAMQQQIIQRAMATFAVKTPPTEAEGCTETRSGLLEAGQVAIRSVVVCTGVALK